MDIFNTKTEKNIPITEENFTNATNKQPPYYVKDRKKESFYAICPMCTNPVQIIGLYKNTIEGGKKPYGKHYKKSIAGLAEYVEEQYQNCPFANSNWKKPYRKRNVTDSRSKEFLTFIKNNYDYIVSFIEHKLKIYISCNFAEELLREYLVSDAWLFRMARIDNLPWTLLDANSSHNLYGRYIIEKCELLEVLTKHPKVNLIEEKYDDGTVRWKVDKSDNEFLKMCFYVCHHKIEGHEEKIKFRVLIDDKKIYEENFIIESWEFEDFISSRQERNQHLNNLAQTLIETHIRV